MSRLPWQYVSAQQQPLWTAGVGPEPQRLAPVPFAKISWRVSCVVAKQPTSKTSSTAASPAPEKQSVEPESQLDYRVGTPEEWAKLVGHSGPVLTIYPNRVEQRELLMKRSSEK